LGTALVIWIFLGVLAGATSAMQTSINSLLGTRVGVTTAALISAIVTTTVMSIWIVPSLRLSEVSQSIKTVPLHEYLGGAFGGIFVISALALAPKIGVAPTTLALVFGQIATSLLVDHCGFLGVPRAPVSALQIIGVVIMGAGLVVALYPKLIR
jgi:transporter family-2 protein